MSETRAEYYKKNRDRILARNKEYYHKRKEDPEYYKTLLKRNQEYYDNGSAKLKKTSTPEEDEKQMLDIINHIKRTNQPNFFTTKNNLLLTKE